MDRLRENKSGNEVITNEKLGEKGNVGKERGRGLTRRKHRSEDGKTDVVGHDRVIHYIQIEISLEKD